MLAALIKSTRFSNIANRFEVTNVSEVDDSKSLEAIRRFTMSDYALFVNDKVKVGMIYNPETGVISDEKGKRVYPPESSEEKIDNLDKTVRKLVFNVDIDSPDITINEVQEYLIGKSKYNLENYLLNHPLVYNGKTYTVTSDKQNQLTGLLNAYNYAKSIGVELSLSWNETGKPCERYTYEQLVNLYLSILAYVKPIVTYQQWAEVAIRSAGSKEEAANVDINFEYYYPQEIPQYDSTEGTNTNTPLPEITEETSGIEQVFEPNEEYEEPVSEEIPVIEDPSDNEEDNSSTN